MKIMNLLKWSLIAALLSVFLSIDSVPANASTGSSSSDTSLTQQNHPLKRFRHNRRKHRRHRRWRKHHHHRRMDINKDKTVPPKNENK